MFRSFIYLEINRKQEKRKSKRYCVKKSKDKVFQVVVLKTRQTANKQSYYKHYQAFGQSRRSKILYLYFFSIDDKMNNDWKQNGKNRYSVKN